MNSRFSAPVWRHAHGRWPNCIAFSYVLLTPLLAASVGLNGGWWALLSILLFFHGLVIAAYLLHECAHATLFRRHPWHLWVGEALSWYCGAAYAPMQRIRHMHLRHHQDRADVVCFDYRMLLAKSPSWFRSAVYGLEWLHLPAVEAIMHVQVMLRPFIDHTRREDRRRVLVVLASRCLLFGLLAALSPWLLLYYALAYLLFLKVLQVADAFAHTYPLYLVSAINEAVPQEQRDAAYDREHTYSNLLSVRWPWLNLWNLNFGYHNVHHDRASVPWHDLPKVHQQTYGHASAQVLPYRELLGSLHRNRLRCIEADDAGSIGSGPGRADDYMGAHGVSFISLV